MIAVHVYGHDGTWAALITLLHTQKLVRAPRLPNAKPLPVLLRHQRESILVQRWPPSRYALVEIDGARERQEGWVVLPRMVFAACVGVPLRCVFELHADAGIGSVVGCLGVVQPAVKLCSSAIRS